MDRWLSDSKKAHEEKEDDKALSKERVEYLKKKMIRGLISTETKPSVEIEQGKGEIEDDFLNSVIEFKNWINSRQYIKGDKEKIEIWIKNLYRKLNVDQDKDAKEKIDLSKSKLMEMYRELPPDFLEESTRIALNKKLRGMKLTNSNQYYIKKLKNLILEKLKEVQYYELLKDLLEI